MSEAVILAIVFTALYMVVAIVHRHQWLKYITQKEAEWQAERKDLLDRIQATTFAEYTNKVISEKKAAQPEEKIEPVEFVS